MSTERTGSNRHELTTEEVERILRWNPPHRYTGTDWFDDGPDPKDVALQEKLRVLLQEPDSEG